MITFIIKCFNKEENLLVTIRSKDVTINEDESMTIDFLGGKAVNSGIYNHGFIEVENAYNDQPIDFNLELNSNVITKDDTITIQRMVFESIDLLLGCLVQSFEARQIKEQLKAQRLSDEFRRTHKNLKLKTIGGGTDEN